MNLRSLKDKVKGFLPDSIWQFFRNRQDHRKKTIRYIEYLNETHPDLDLSLLDIGARGGLEGEYDLMTGLKSLKAFGVEPDPEAAKCLEESGQWEEVFQEALSDAEGDCQLNITKHIGCSTLLEPDRERLKNYSNAHWFDISRKLEIQTTSADKLFSNHAAFDFIKMDVQGAESRILDGAEKTFPKAVCISMETQFEELYQGQKTFSYLHQWFLKHNYKLIKLLVSGFGDGEVIEASNAVYLRDFRGDFSRNDLLKCILAALCWNNGAYIELMLRNKGNLLLEDKEYRELLSILNVNIKKPINIPEAFRDEL